VELYQQNKQTVTTGKKTPKQTLPQNAILF